MRMRPALYDLHFHLDFAKDPEALLRDAAAKGIGFLAVSCDVDGYEKARAAVSGAECRDAVAAVGLHPWWVARDGFDMAQVERFEALAPGADAFGELGLDFADRHAPACTHGLQVEVLRRACRAAAASARAAGRRKPLSLHAVRSADAVLDVLEDTGCLESCACIFHWFSGSGPQLRRAIQAGCWFSVNAMGLRTGKGREYAKVMPEDKLLLETDLPPESADAFDVREWRRALQAALDGLREATGRDCLERCGVNARRLLAPAQALGS